MPVRYPGSPLLPCPYSAEQTILKGRVQCFSGLFMWSQVYRASRSHIFVGHNLTLMVLYRRYRRVRLYPIIYTRIISRGETDVIICAEMRDWQCLQYYSWHRLNQQESVEKESIQCILLWIDVYMSGITDIHTKRQLGVYWYAYWPLYYVIV